MGSYGENTLVRGLTFLTEKQASIANNLANVDTTSFKRRTAIAQDTGDRFQTLFDRQMSAVDYAEHSNMQRGTLRETGHKMDVALDGPQWLRVQNGNGDLFYTRNGQLSIGKDGNLTTRNGLNVLNREGAPIQLNTDGATPLDLLFSPNGTITEQATGETFGPIAMITLDRPEALVPVGKWEPCSEAGGECPFSERFTQTGEFVYSTADNSSRVGRPRRTRHGRGQRRTWTFGMFRKATNK